MCGSLYCVLLQDSVETVISRDRRSWEDPTTSKVGETADLPHTLSPHETWQPTTATSPSVVLDVDSTTDTDSDVGGDDSSELEPDYESSEYENSSTNWELELLVEQMRKRRSASLDHNLSVRKTRKKFARSGSADTRRDWYFVMEVVAVEVCYVLKQ